MKIRIVLTLFFLTMIHPHLLKSQNYCEGLGETTLACFGENAWQIICGLDPVTDCRCGNRNCTPCSQITPSESSCLQAYNTSCNQENISINCQCGICTANQETLCENLTDEQKNCYNTSGNITLICSMKNFYSQAVSLCLSFKK